nr:MAG TPA: hypothetical protein [Caudoviricetes sp.]
MIDLNHYRIVQSFVCLVHASHYLAIIKFTRTFINRLCDLLHC